MSDIRSAEPGRKGLEQLGVRKVSCPGDVPIGRTGIQHIVVDLVFGPPGGTEVAVRLRAYGKAGGTEVALRLRAYGKEGLVSRKPTRRLANEVWTAVCDEFVDGAASSEPAAAASSLVVATESLTAEVPAVLAAFTAPG